MYGRFSSPRSIEITNTFGAGTPSYVSSVKPGRFPLVLRNLHYPAICLNFLAMLFLLALVPLDTILGGANVLSVLATVVCIHCYAVIIIILIRVLGRGKVAANLGGCRCCSGSLWGSSHRCVTIPGEGFNLFSVPRC